MFNKISDLRKMYYFLIEKATKDNSDDDDNDNDDNDDENTKEEENQTKPTYKPDPEPEPEYNPIVTNDKESKNKKYLMYGIITLMILFVFYMLMK